MGGAECVGALSKGDELGGCLAEGLLSWNSWSDIFGFHGLGASGVFIYTVFLGSVTFHTFFHHLHTCFHELCKYFYFACICSHYLYSTFNICGIGCGLSSHRQKRKSGGSCGGSCWWYFKLFHWINYLNFSGMFCIQCLAIDKVLSNQKNCYNSRKIPMD